MSLVSQVAIFYAIGAVITGGVIAAHRTVTFNFRGKPVRHPRLWAGIVSGLIWPAVILKMLWPQ